MFVCFVRCDFIDTTIQNTQTIKFKNILEYRTQIGG